MLQTRGIDCERLRGGGSTVDGENRENVKGSPVDARASQEALPIWQANAQDLLLCEEAKNKQQYC